MKTVGKYNLYKGVSTALTVGTPIGALLLCSDMFIHRSDTAISAAGVFAFLFALLFMKDKLMENFKMPSPLIISIAGLIIIIMIESILDPLKIVFVSTIASCGIDALTFRHLYKSIENEYESELKKYKHFGFVFGSTDKIIGD